VALVTGAARRVGAEIVRTLHASGFNIALHYRSSSYEAHALQKKLNEIRADSVVLFQADLLKPNSPMHLINTIVEKMGRLDVLVNNASSFYPTTIGSITEEHWDDLIGSNMKAPLFLSQAAAKALKKSSGCIVNIADIHAEKPLKNHTVYCMAKAGVVMLTKSLARELGPEVRVNAVAPGAIMWPEDEMDELTRKRILSLTALKRKGDPSDIARTILFLIRDAGYITGQVIAVDGGRSITGK
jgi:pteridine reductase